jgi:hypothetical protein
MPTASRQGDTNVVTTVTRVPPRRSGHRVSLILAGLLSAACSDSSKISQAVSDTSKSMADAASAAAAQLGLVEEQPAKGVPVKPVETSPPPAAKSNSSSRPALAAAPKDSQAAVGQKSEPLAQATEAESAARVSTAAVPADTSIVAEERDPTPVPVRHGTPIYSEDDPDVTPPELLISQESNPVFRGIQPDMNTMELVVSELGRVEQVQLLTPARRMTDMLLLSGAKTWKFSPAMRNGQPVRYRTAFSWPSVP